ncbi:ThuA domain-containing protein [Allorhodopirellula heiligendammensis]|uniref:Trehalose utilization n=1 Tax=Allorhodopirellula heiligendammensis TaxID=2714739 RepID=A0A5C6BY01_9BACT|nr:ThuA domain-containing protein [Allorhodopirellula heiligendammensis]TWU16662.1 Trehalose utilization [Allorhodopirellula heiligendammensis]
MITLPRLLIVLTLFPLALWTNRVTAQDSVDPWQKKKSEVFKPLTDDTKQAILDAVPQAPTVKPQAARKILVFYRCEGFIHGSIPHANEAIRAMAEKTRAFDVDFADTYDVFTPENLQQYDLVLLNNTTGMQFQKPSQQNALLDFIAAGKGLAGIHAASDNFGDFPKCRALIGGQFGGHPWGAGGNWAFKLDDPDHALNRAFGGHGFWHRDEIYQYQPSTYQGPQVLRLLVSLDMNQADVANRIADGPREVPVSWIRTAGDGRIFYTNFGHRNETFENPAMLSHILDGIQYAIGDLSADATPTADAGDLQPALAPNK